MGKTAQNVKVEAATRWHSLRLHKHSLVEHKLTLMRDVRCSAGRFRQLTRELAMFLAFEVTRDLPLQSKSVITPDAVTQAEMIAGKKALIIPILRAGLVLAEGALEVMPAAHVGHIGFRRDEETRELSEHMVVLPDPRDRLLILLDAGIGTGDTACGAIEILKNEGVEENSIRFGTILITPTGMDQIAQKYPDVIVHALSMEDGVNDQNHIVPGFGNASDRLFGIQRS